jgi:uncharacterized protein YciI
MPEDGHLMLLYDYVQDMAERRGPYREAHLERIRTEQRAGHIIMAGALGNPGPDDLSEAQKGEAGRRAGSELTGAAIVFRGVGPQHVERFVAADPYVEAGLVTSWSIRRWNLV